MWRYIKAAFWVRPDIPSLGRVPVNLLAVLGFSILGAADPAFWLLGLGLETTFLFSMGFNKRFQRVVDAMHLEVSDDDAERNRITLVRTLPPESQKRLEELHRNCGKISEINQQTGDLVIDTNRDALQRLEWVYLKLLVARNNLLTAGPKESEEILMRKIADLERDVRSGRDNEALLNSKSATINILKERVGNIHRRRQTLEEIDSDLTRIESQVELILENTTMQGKPSTISTDIELASNLFASNLFGDSEITVAALDRTYGDTKTPSKTLDKESA